MHALEVLVYVPKLRCFIERLDFISRAGVLDLELVDLMEIRRARLKFNANGFSLHQMSFECGVVALPSSRE